MMNSNAFVQQLTWVCAEQTCEDVLETTGVQLVVVAGVQTKPHHLQVVEKLLLWFINTFKRRVDSSKLNWLKRLQQTLALCFNYIMTFGVEESKQLSAQRSVGHCFFEEQLLLSQLLRAEVLRLACHPVVVVQHSQQSSICGPGKERALVQVLEQPGNADRTKHVQSKGEGKEWVSMTGYIVFSRRRGEVSLGAGLGVWHQSLRVDDQLWGWSFVWVQSVKSLGESLDFTISDDATTSSVNYRKQIQKIFV